MRNIKFSDEIKENNLLVIDSNPKIYKLINICYKSEEKLFFRGQSNFNWVLESNFYRDMPKNIDKNLLKTIKQNNNTWIERIKFLKDHGYKFNNLEALSQMQHYGTKTPLIDFTSYILHALWFCLENNLNSKTDKALYIISYNKNLKSQLQDLNEKDIIYKCPSDINRGLSQKSFFILDNQIWEEKVDEQSLFKIKIKNHVVKEIQKLLLNNQISASQIFPDIKGVMKEFESEAYMHFWELGFIYDAAKDYNKALTSYNRAIEINPNEPTLHFNKATTLLDKSKSVKSKKESIKLIKSSIEFFDKALNLSQDIAPAISNKGNAISALAWKVDDDNEKYNLLKQASELYENANKIAPWDNQIIFNWARAIIELTEKYDGMERNELEYNKALKICNTANPRHPHYNLVSSLIQELMFKINYLEDYKR